MSMPISRPRTYQTSVPGPDEARERPCGDRVDRRDGRRADERRLEDRPERADRAGLRGVQVAQRDRRRRHVQVGVVDGARIERGAVGPRDPLHDDVAAAVVAHGLAWELLLAGMPHDRRSRACPAAWSARSSTGGSRVPAGMVRPTWAPTSRAVGGGVEPRAARAQRPERAAGVAAGRGARAVRGAAPVSQPATATGPGVRSSSQACASGIERTARSAATVGKTTGAVPRGRRASGDRRLAAGLGGAGVGAGRGALGPRRAVPRAPSPPPTTRSDDRRQQAREPQPSMPRGAGRGRSGLDDHPRSTDVAVSAPGRPDASTRRSGSARSIQRTRRSMVGPRAPSIARTYHTGWPGVPAMRDGPGLRVEPPDVLGPHEHREQRQVRGVERGHERVRSPLAPQPVVDQRRQAHPHAARPGDPVDLELVVAHQGPRCCRRQPAGRSAGRRRGPASGGARPRPRPARWPTGAARRSGRGRARAAGAAGLSGPATAYRRGCPGGRTRGRRVRPAGRRCTANRSPRRASPPPRWRRPAAGRSRCRGPRTARSPPGPRTSSGS